jgi:hypothetical protein
VHLSTTGSAEPQDAQIPNASNIASITANLLPNRRYCQRLCIGVVRILVEMID